MWNRVELKNNAKQIMRKNYWWIVLISVITAIAIGQGIRLNVNLGTNGISTKYSNGLMGRSSGSYFDQIINGSGITNMKPDSSIDISSQMFNVRNYIKNIFSGIDRKSVV